MVGQQPDHSEQLGVRTLLGIPKECLEEIGSPRFTRSTEHPVKFSALKEFLGHWKQGRDQHGVHGNASFTA